MIRAVSITAPGGRSRVLPSARIPIPYTGPVFFSRLWRSFSSVPDVLKGVNDDGCTTKPDLARVVAKKHGLTISLSSEVIDTVLDAIVDSVSKGKVVKCDKFGTFKLYTSKERPGRNPMSGAAITIPAQGRIRFRPYVAFKDSVNSK